MHSQYLLYFFLYKHVPENIRFIGWVVMDFHFIISSHFTSVTAFIRMCDLGQENVQPKAKMKGLSKLTLPEYPKHFFLSPVICRTKNEQEKVYKGNKDSL